MGSVQARQIARTNKQIRNDSPRAARVHQRAPPRGWLAPGTGSGNSSEPRVASWSLITLHHHRHYSTTDGYVYDRRPPHYDHASASPPSLQGLQPQSRQGRWFANPHPSAHEEFSAFCGLVSSPCRDEARRNGRWSKLASLEEGPRKPPSPPPKPTRVHRSPPARYR